MTINQKNVAGLTDADKATAAKNGMTDEQFAASKWALGSVGFADWRKDAVMAVLKNKEAALAAFDRIAALDIDYTPGNAPANYAHVINAILAQ